MEVIIDGIVYVPKENKSKLEMLEEKYKSGNYICIGSKVGSIDKISELEWPKWHADWEYKLIHKKHKNILDAWLADNNVEIEFEDMDGAWKPNYEFIKEYNEQYEYKLKQQYPIFKRNEDGEVFRFDAIEGDGGYGQWVLHKNPAVLGVSVGTTPNSPVFETIPYDKEKGLYHLQPCWVDNYVSTYIDFYDTKAIYDMNLINNIRPITIEQLRVMQFVWEMYQQVLKDIK